MPFSGEVQKLIREYVYGHLPDDNWYHDHFYPFIQDVELRNRLIIEFRNARVIYKIFEGIQAENELLLAQIKTQVVMYVSIQEAILSLPNLPAVRTFVILTLISCRFKMLFLAHILFATSAFCTKIPKNRPVFLCARVKHRSPHIPPKNE